MVTNPIESDNLEVTFLMRFLKTYDIYTNDTFLSHHQFSYNKSKWVSARLNKRHISARIREEWAPRNMPKV